VLFSPVGTRMIFRSPPIPSPVMVIPIDLFGSSTRVCLLFRAKAPGPTIASRSIVLPSLLRTLMSFIAPQFSWSLSVSEISPQMRSMLASISQLFSIITIFQFPVFRWDGMVSYPWCYSRGNIGFAAGRGLVGAADSIVGCRPRQATAPPDWPKDLFDTSR